ncbi:MAG: right-handed parallel beta-helix repeat-containing protein [Candidatus Desantisbacteria bacterium]
MATCETIQAGINACPVGGTVSVSAGTYTDLVEINKRIALVGMGTPTIIPPLEGAVVFFSGDSADGAYISGFRITGATGEGGHGISCTGGAEPLITNNTILGNSNGGILCSSSSPTITNNTISGNGYNGISCSSSSPTITNNTISGNGYNGISCSYSPPTITNNTITENGTTSINYYGIHNDTSNSGTPIIRYNCVWGNGSSTTQNYYNCVPGTHAISANPQFITSSNYHLQSSSPCINSGSNTAPGISGTSTDKDGNPRIVNGTVDMGAYEYQGTQSVLPLNITTTSLPSGQVATYYQATLTVTGGTLPYNWSYSGNLPTGLSLSANGIISGTPTNTGTGAFTAQVVDQVGSSASKELSIYIAATSTATIPIKPATSYQHSPGDEFDVNIQVGSATTPISDLFGISFKLNYDTTLLDVVTPYNTNVTAGDMLGSDVVFVQNVDESAGQVSIGVSRKAGQGGVSGSGNVAKVRFKMSPNAIGSTTATFSLTNVSAMDSTLKPITLAPETAGIHVVQRLATPGLISPEDNALANQVDLNYEWSAVSGVVHYQFELDNNSDFSSPEIVATTTATIYNPSSLYGPLASSLPDATYCWRVKACDTLDSNWSSVRSVKVTTLVLNPQAPATVTTGSEFVVDVRVGSDTRVSHTYPANDLFGVSFSLFFDRTDILNVATTGVAIENGGFLGANPIIYSTIVEDNGDGRGRVDIAMTRKNGEAGASGYGSLVKVRFTTNGTATGIGFKTSDVGHLINAYNAGGSPVVIAGWQNTIDVVPQPVFPMVWPGDTNNDGIVNEQDILPIAVNWMANGATRPNASIFWKAQPMPNIWNGMYADTDGNGTVDGADVMAIGANFKATHTVTGGSSPAPSLLDSQIDQSKYLEAYRQMYHVLETSGLMNGTNELKQALAQAIETGVTQQQIEATPAESTLLQNYPNPFNPECWIPFELSEKANVVIRIYNISGQLVKTLDLGVLETGAYTTQSRAAHWNGRNEEGEEIASGVYFYQMQAGNKVMTKRAVVLK